ncbi:MAG: type IV pilus secretin PilQ [Bacteriovoracaceae bacterium]|nr:type IV pilus secretin PilQ [Bacteriovoracaceae bacterium]
MFKWIFCLLCLTCVFANAQDNNPAKITNVHFLPEGEISKLIIDFDRPVFAERTHIKDTRQIILDLKNVTAQKKFMRGIDTSEFSGSADFISPYKKPGEKNSIRFAVQLRDNVRSILDQKGKRVVLNIENRFGAFSRATLKKAEDNGVAVDDSLEEKVLIPKSASISDILENLTQSGVKKYVGKKISINVNNVSYRELLKMIADTSGFNIIIDDQINELPPLTISLTNIPWDQALDTIMNLGELVAFKHANILTVKTGQKAREEREAKLASQNANRRQEPLVTRVFPISFADPNAMVGILNDYLSPERGAIKIDERTSHIIVKDTIDAIERMKKIIETLDTETPQVLIEAKVVEANEDYEFRAGLGRRGLSFGYDPLTPGASLEDNSGSFSFSSATDAEFSNILSASIGVYKRLTGLNFSLQLMESESKGRIISSPKIITQNNQAASITSTDTQKFKTSTVNNGTVTEGFEDVSVSINLTVTPKVTNDGSISMNVDLTKGGFTAPATADGLPSTSNKAINTNVLVDNGSTVVIGGLYQTSTSEIEAGIPFLKDLPLIGWLFRNAYNPNRSRSELIVFLTPRVVNQEEAGLVNRDSEGLVGI